MLVLEPIIHIISIIWWVLCLVLFYKIWRMCNDIHKIKNQIDKNDDFSTKIEFLLRIGEKEKAKEILLNRILSDETIFSSTSTPVEKIDEIYQRHKDELEALGIEVSTKE